MSDLKEVLKNHKLWPEGNGGERANLVGADLQGADLRGANLVDANLVDANLVDANLVGADLRDAKLRNAKLVGADLRDADLRNANLQGADLRGTNLVDANLVGADLRDADLRDADLRGSGVIVLTLPFYTAYVHKHYTRIGCRYHSNQEWKSFSDEEIAEMDSNALEFWSKCKKIIFAAMESEAG